MRLAWIVLAPVVALVLYHILEPALRHLSPRPAEARVTARLSDARMAECRITSLKSAEKR